MSEWMVISFLKIRKHCPGISSKMTINYGIYLLISTVVTCVLFWSKGTQFTGILYGVAGAMLVSLSVVDWNTRYIPFEWNVIIFLCGLIRIFADFSNWLEYVIGLFAVSGFLFLVDRISVPLLKKRYSGMDMEIDHAIGDGDIKLMAATGLLIGWKLNLLALAIGCIAGSVIHLGLMMIKKGERQLALGPYLSLGVLSTMIC